MSRILIRSGRLIDPASGIDALLDLAVADGRVAALGPVADFQPDQTIDATGCIVCPGFIDLCARLREPGAEHKADIASETRTAARAGITTLVCPPDTEPVIDEPAVVELIRRRAEAGGFARVLTLGALTRGLAGEQLAEMAALRAAGCVGVSNAWRPVASNLVMRRALEYAATFELTVFVNPLDHALAAGGCAHDGAMATRLGLNGIPVVAETAAMAVVLELAGELGVRVHLGCLSSARAVELLARARDNGLRVSADVSAHQLHLSEGDLGRFDSRLHVVPPLRADSDREALRRALSQGTIDALCSDHQPHESDAKADPFAETEPGVSGLDTLLGLGLRLVEDGLLPLPTLVERLTAAPARVLNLPLGRLGAGDRADVCVFDPGGRWRVGPQTLCSRGHNTPFLGRELPGRVSHTLLAGRLVTPPETSPCSAPATGHPDD